MKTLALTLALMASLIPFVEEPQYLHAPKPSVIQFKRK